MARMRVPIDFFELSEKFNLKGWIDEDIEMLSKIRNKIRKEIDKIWREERKIFPPITPEEKKKHEELVRKRLELERIRNLISYRWVRIEKRYSTYMSERLGIIPYEFYEELVLDNLFEVFMEISERVKGFTVKPKYEYWIPLRGWRKDPIDISELKKNRAQFIESWARIHAAQHTFSTPGKGGRERHFEGLMDTYILFAYARRVGEEYVLWVAEDGINYDIESYFTTLFEHLLRMDDDTRFIIENMGISSEDLIGGIDIKEIYISDEMIKEVPFYARLYDHDYNLERLEVSATLDRYYWYIDPEEVAERIYLEGEVKITKLTYRRPARRR